MQKCTFHSAATSMMTSRILKSVGFTKTFREQNIFSSNKQIHQLHIKGYFIATVAKVTFNTTKEFIVVSEVKLEDGCQFQYSEMAQIAKTNDSVLLA